MTIAAATVHLDAQSGLDAAGGLSPEQAWKTLAQANKADLKPGDTLRNNLIFHAGTAWFDKNFTAAPTDILAKDPLFVNPGSCSENGDYRLKPGSPAIMPALPWAMRSISMGGLCLRVECPISALMNPGKALLGLTDRAGHAFPIQETFPEKDPCFENPEPAPRVKLRA